MNSSTGSAIVEWAPFEVAKHVTDVELLEAANTIERDFLQKQKGYVRRELLKKEGRQWVDLVYWRSLEDATMAAKDANESQACLQYFSLMNGVENAEEGISHYTQINTWKKV